MFVSELNFPVAVLVPSLGGEGGLVFSNASFTFVSSMTAATHGDTHSERALWGAGKVDLSLLLG